MKRLESSLIAVLADPTPQQAILAGLAARETVLLESLDAELLRAPGGSGMRRRAFLQLLADRQRLSGSLTRHLAMLGLNRSEPAITDLSAYFEEEDESKNTETNDPAGDAEPADLR